MNAEGAAQPLRSSRLIQEFRIDFLLEEEFCVDPAFVQAFIAACGLDFIPEAVTRVVNSLSDEHGEADLLVLISKRALSGQILAHALLIEDKISAGFQPAQAARYQRRGYEGTRSQNWDEFTTILVAPQAYIPNNHGFDAAVSLEQIKTWICKGDVARQSFKIRKIDEAIHKKNATGVQIVDSNMTLFRTAYYEALQEFNARRGTDFTMRPPAPTYSGDTWFVLKSASLPKWVQFRHMAPNGSVEMSFQNTDFIKAAALRGLLDKDIALIKTGKYDQHVTLRLPAPKISSFSNFSAAQGDVEAALQGAERLLRLAINCWVQFDEILQSARN